MNRALKVGFVTAVICLAVLGVAALGRFLYVRYADATSRIKELEERVAQLESREICQIRVWSEIISTHGSNGVLQLTKEAELQEFRIARPGRYEKGWFSEAWVVDYEPPDEILKFDKFSVSARKDGVVLTAKPRTNEPIYMRFTIVGVKR